MNGKKKKNVPVLSIVFVARLQGGLKKRRSRRKKGKRGEVTIHAPPPARNKGEREKGCSMFGREMRRFRRASRREKEGDARHRFGFNSARISEGFCTAPAQNHRTNETHCEEERGKGKTARISFPDPKRRKKEPLSSRRQKGMFIEKSAGTAQGEKGRG